MSIWDRDYIKDEPKKERPAPRLDIPVTPVFSGLQVFLFLSLVFVVGLFLYSYFLDLKNNSVLISAPASVSVVLPVPSSQVKNEFPDSPSYSAYFYAAQEEKHDIFLSFINLPENKHLKKCYLENYCTKDSVMFDIKKREEHEAEKARRKAELGVK